MNAHENGNCFVRHSVISQKRILMVVFGFCGFNLLRGVFL